VRTAAHPAETRLDVLAEILQQIEADQPGVVGPDRVAMAGVRNPAGFRMGGQDVQLSVDGDREDHVVHRVAGRPHAGGERKVARLGIGQDRFEVPQAVITCKGVDPNRARMYVAAS
jgi:hypothetical protein